MGEPGITIVLEEAKPSDPPRPDASRPKAASVPAHDGTSRPKETDPKEPPKYDLKHDPTTGAEPPKTSVILPCKYRTGKILGSGSYAIVKEAIHIETGKQYACKVINHKLLERKHMVHNEIMILKRVSSGHRNIVTLHDYFATPHNLYLVFDLCTGGELFARIIHKGYYYESDAANLVRTLFEAVKYIHDCGIVHRDLKPENLLFRTEKEDADIMIADFGLSRIMQEDKFQLLTEICGTHGYMAPEIFEQTGYGKPVDVWAMGVITYFLLCGYLPFDGHGEDTEREVEAVRTGDYKFEPEELWVNVSTTARDFISKCLTLDPAERPTAKDALNHRWLADSSPHFVEDQHGDPTNLLPHIQKVFNAKKTWRKAIFSITAVRRMSTSNAKLSNAAQILAPHLAQYKRDSETETLDEDHKVVQYGHDAHHHPPAGEDQQKEDSSERSTPSYPILHPEIGEDQQRDNSEGSAPSSFVLPPSKKRKIAL